MKPRTHAAWCRRRRSAPRPRPATSRCAPRRARTCFAFLSGRRARLLHGDLDLVVAEARMELQVHRQGGHALRFAIARVLELHLWRVDLDNRAGADAVDELKHTQ